jgi:predicted type IV restriction endonuclease
MSSLPAPAALLDLVSRFREQLPDYKRGRYNETQLRRDFLDPLFRLLGWDVDNSAGYAESFREVVHEDAVKVGGTTKAPDYSFRLGGRRLFFLEAKKPSVFIKEDIAPAYQLRRYAWSAGLQLSVLSDFEEFAVYDGSVKPGAKDKPSKARVFYCTFEDYAAKWDEIAALFSKDAVLRGGIERFVKKLPGRRGTAAVDAEFLAQIESWREVLARNIALRNPGLDAHGLNHAVQATIDRIVFLRICEDRGIEDEGRLLAQTNGPGIYPRLVSLFRDADDRYNSGLFHFKAEKSRPYEPDEYTLRLAIDDKPLRDIILGLYYPASPYEFSVLPADILGSVYERFLGKVIRLTAGGQAKVEDKPEVKKAGGVYYTPTHIVDYIVRQTVGRLLEGRTPRQAEKLRICDPACGSGSFLIGAYQYLLDWHLKQYTAQGPEKLAGGRNPRLRRAFVPSPSTGEGQGGGEGGWRLTVGERKRILLANLYGVDIDPQAVEVTKLSLLLKVLEGETGETLGLKQLKLFHERALPDLDANILCGNSLIGGDFFDGRLDLEAEERRRINAFDWAAGFPGVFTPTPTLPRQGGGGQSPSPSTGEGRDGGEGGFDAVIGNPPYIRIQTLKEWAPLEVEHYKTAYRAASKGNYDIYAVFVERGLQLLNPRGRLGFILPHKFFNAEYGEPLRGLISAGRHLAEVVHFGHQQVFDQATTYTCLLFLDKAGAKSCRFQKVDNLLAWRAASPPPPGEREPGSLAPTSFPRPSHLPGGEGVDIPARSITSAPWNFASGPEGALFDRLMAMPVKLGDVAHLFVGLQTDADDVFILEETGRSKGKVECFSKATGQSHFFEAEHLKPLLKGSLNIRRYNLSQVNKLLIFPYGAGADTSRLIPIDEYKRLFPLTWAYLEANKARLSRRAKGQLGMNWYGYVYKKNHSRFTLPKLLAPAIAQGACFAADLEGKNYFVGSGGGGGGGYGIAIAPTCPLSPLYVLGILNSSVTDAMLKSISTPFRGGYIALNRQYIEQVPIRAIDKKDPADRTRHDHMVALVESMLKLHKQLAAATTAHDKTLIQRQIDATDRQIDTLVYELYGLTPAEIALVEGGAP